jgi:hypothetical protein
MIHMADIRWGRVVLAAVAAEVAVILSLLAASAVFKVPGESAGYYVAPPASALATFLMVLWIARKLESRFILHGVLVGLVGVVDLSSRRNPRIDGCTSSPSSFESWEAIWVV